MKPLKKSESTSKTTDYSINQSEIKAEANDFKSLKSLN